MGGDIEITPGLQRDAIRQIMGAEGEAFGAGLTPASPSPFVGTDTLAANVWAGGSTASLFSPTCTWIDATGLATFQMSFSATETATLATGYYRFLVTVTRGGATGKVDSGRIKVGLAPGTATVPLAFTARADLVKYAPWLEQLDGADDETAFADEQARATNQLINDLVALWRFGAGMAPQIGQPGWNAMTLFGFNGAPPSKWLRDVLVPLVPSSTIPADMAGNRQNTAANLIQPRVSTALLLYDEVLEICAKRAIALVCERQISEAMDKNWGALAARYRLQARNLFLAQKFAIDLSNPQTGWASIVIQGGATSLR